MKERLSQTGIPWLLLISTFLYDALFLIGIPLIILALDQTPTNFQRELIMYHDSPTLLDLWSTHFIHDLDSSEHLTSNLRAYFPLAAIAYAISWDSGRLKEFRAILAFLLIVAAPLISIINLWTLGPTIRLMDPTVTGPFNNKGFSALGGALAGYLLVATIDLAKGRTPVPISFYEGGKLAFWYVFTVVFLESFQEYGSLDMTVWIGLLILVLIGLGNFIYSVKPFVDEFAENDGDFRTLFTWMFENPVVTLLLVGGFLTFIAASKSLVQFPPFLGGENAVGHLLGLLIGAMASVLFYQTGEGA